MNSQAKNRTLTIIVGMLTALVILFSQSLFHQAQAKLEKNKTEQQAANKTEISIAPADALINSTSITVEDQIPTLVERIISSENKAVIIAQTSDLVINFFKTLFSVFIAPNAP